jgi:hypothetical protein
MVDRPTESDTNRDPGDEFAGKLQCLPEPGGTAGIRAFTPGTLFRSPRRKSCFEIAPAALEVVVANVRPVWLSGPGFAGFVWPNGCGHRNLPAQPAANLLSASKSRAT